ncbi:uncharacterized protein PV07_08659 [Cladophialophora immunda]|uniref:Uncharacterized protein n=1 Tax=Cladophialophora immunda TaxID=569365 RepID=A0A0D2C2P6_9EURO|nr:uncharacterized protein PV07_08659 [Cladophialophora immunda]KIW25493.1 hypothetical protein PV07_08659 [Cladophialophora immunda]
MESSADRQAMLQLLVADMNQSHALPQPLATLKPSDFDRWEQENGWKRVEAAFDYLTFAWERLKPHETRQTHPKAKISLLLAYTTVLPGSRSIHTPGRQTSSYPATSTTISLFFRSKAFAVQFQMAATQPGQQPQTNGKSNMSVHGSRAPAKIHGAPAEIAVEHHSSQTDVEIDPESARWLTVSPYLEPEHLLDLTVTSFLRTGDSLDCSLVGVG